MKTPKSKRQKKAPRALDDDDKIARSSVVPKNNSRADVYRTALSFAEIRTSATNNGAVGTCIIIADVLSKYVIIFHKRTCEQTKNDYERKENEGGRGGGKRGGTHA